ncbi:MAG: hypothetical protein NTNFB02_31330 [Nitrospira sp.]
MTDDGAKFPSAQAGAVTRMTSSAQAIIPVAVNPYAPPDGADNRTLETERTMIACPGLSTVR